MNILEMIGTSYSQFGTCLLHDKNGIKIATIEESNNGKVGPIVKEIFKNWLKGMLSLHCVYTYTIAYHISEGWSGIGRTTFLPH